MMVAGCATMRLLYLATLGISAVTQLGFGLLFLLAPSVLVGHAGLTLTRDVHSLMLNLGALVVFVAGMCALALRWRAREEGYVIGASVGALLLTMGIGHAFIGVWAPVVWDGVRGLVLIVTASVLGRRLHQPG